MENKSYQSVKVAERRLDCTRGGLNIGLLGSSKPGFPVWGSGARVAPNARNCGIMSNSEFIR